MLLPLLSGELGSIQHRQLRLLLPLLSAHLPLVPLLSGHGGGQRFAQATGQKREAVFSERTQDLGRFGAGLPPLPPDEARYRGQEAGGGGDLGDNSCDELQRPASLWKRRTWSTSGKTLSERRSTAENKSFFCMTIPVKEF